MKTTVQFDADSANGNYCVLHFSMSGTKQAIYTKLLDMAEQIHADYGKPIQGIVSAFEGTSHVITPVWNGKEY